MGLMVRMLSKRSEESLGQVGMLSSVEDFSESSARDMSSHER